MSLLATLGLAATSILAQSSDYLTSYYAADTAAAGGLAALTGIWLVVAICAGLIGLVFFAFNIWMAIDCYKRTDAELPNKQTWLIVMIVGLFFSFGWIAAIIYYFQVKRKLPKAAK